MMHMYIDSVILAGSSNANANFDSNTANRSLQPERQEACRDSHVGDCASICNNNETFKGQKAYVVYEHA